MRARMEGTGRWGVCGVECGLGVVVGGATGGVHACVCVCVCCERVSVAGMGKLDLFFSWSEEGGWRGVVGFSNGTSLYFIYLQMEENENVFWIGFLHAFSFCSHVLVFLAA